MLNGSEAAILSPLPIVRFGGSGTVAGKDYSFVFSLLYFANILPFGLYFPLDQRGYLLL